MFDWGSARICVFILNLPCQWWENEAKWRQIYEPATNALLHDNCECIYWFILCRWVWNQNVFLCLCDTYTQTQDWDLWSWHQVTEDTSLQCNSDNWLLAIVIDWLGHLASGFLSHASSMALWIEMLVIFVQYYGLWAHAWWKSSNVHQPSPLWLSRPTSQ